jgi:hypothetical protein
MSITPITPTVRSGTWSDTGHFSAKTQALSGSDLNANQQPETKASVSNKISRGGFPTSFFLAAMKAIGRDVVRLDDP